MTAPRLHVPLIVAVAAVTAVLVGDSSGLLADRDAVVLDNAAQFAAGAFAAVACAGASRRTTGVERTWRRLMAIGMAGWSVGQLVWSYYQIFRATPLPGPSLADVGYLTLPVFAFAALLSLATEGLSRRPGAVGGSRLRAALVLGLDGFVVVGSLFILTWSTALGAVVHAGAPSRLAFGVAIAYPITDLLLVVMVVLLLATRPVPSRVRPQLVLLGLGLVGLSASDSVFAYLVSSGAETMPPAANAGFIAGPLLVGLAALNRSEAPAPASTGQRRGPAEWFHLLLPYLPLGATGVLLAGQVARGREPDLIEMIVGLTVVGLVVVRQMVTLIDNTVLLGRVSDAQDRLTYQAYHDPLTGLANRALFRDRLVSAIDQHRPFAVLYVDLDDFKAVNDSLGHVAGDRVLRTVAERLRSCVRSVDTVARLGGDEFGALVHGDADLPDRVGRRMLAALRRPLQVDGRPVTVAASLGAAVPDPSEPSLTADALLRRADAAMYAGKRQGKGLLVWYGPETADGSDNPDLPTLLADALAGGPERSGIDVLYQPIVRMSNGERVAVEALARWSHTQIGDVPPSVFVAVAEKAGLVGALDDFVLDRACGDVAAHLARHGTAPAVHVNISASRLGNPDLEQTVADTLARHGLSPGHLVLEVTESCRIPDPAAAAGSARRLRASGVRLALDDFGTGFNTLAQLHELPVDIVKLDRTFTAVGSGSLRAEALCESLVSIAADLAITVIAEGVETRAQGAALARLGCGFGQGHLYGRPAPLSASPAPAAVGVGAAGGVGPAAGVGTAAGAAVPVQRAEFTSGSGRRYWRGSRTPAG